MGQKACRRYFQTAERFFADKAMSLGLVDEVVALEELDSAVNAILEKVDTIISPLNNQNHDLGGAISLPTKISQKSDDSDLFALPSDQLKPSLADAMASADARAEAARVNRIAAE
mgnify:CR=1 FL=1